MKMKKKTFCVSELNENLADWNSGGLLLIVLEIGISFSPCNPK